MISGHELRIDYRFIVNSFGEGRIVQGFFGLADRITLGGHSRNYKRLFMYIYIYIYTSIAYFTIYTCTKLLKVYR